MSELTDQLTDLGVAQASQRLAARDVSSEELTRAFLERTLALDQGTSQAIGAYLELSAESALDQARAADALLASGDPTAPLTGVPIALKDIFITRDLATTCASKILAGFKPRFDGTVVARLREAGAVITGKLNMDEFAMGSSTENSALGTTRNPWNRACVPGGSSGGSAAAVAARMVPGSFGTDTGGSIRQPAALCGVVGMKPTYGRVSRYGVIAFASSLDQVGPLANNVEDTALLFEAVAGHDPRDSTSIPQPAPDCRGSLHDGAKGLRVGVPREYFGEGLDPEVEKSVRALLAALEREGASLVEVELPHTEYAVATYYIVATAEASSNLGRYDGVRYGLREGEDGGLTNMYGASRDAGFGAEVKRRIVLGSYALSAGYYDAYYLKAMKVRTLIRRDFDLAFQNCDVLLTPTSPDTAFELGSRTDDPLKMYLSDVLTIPCNLAGLPGLSLPCGLDSKGLPIGAQLLAPPLAEPLLFRAARACEKLVGFDQRPPEQDLAGSADK